MITIETDGTLTGHDANGNRFNHNSLEGGLYDAMLATLNAQVEAASINVQAVATYNRMLTDAQNAENAGRRDDQTPIPAKPQQKVVSDVGSVTWVDFVPPLADFKPIHPDPSKVITTDAATQSQRIDMTYLMVQALYNKLVLGK